MKSMAKCYPDELRKLWTMESSDGLMPLRFLIRDFIKDPKENKSGLKEVIHLFRDHPDVLRVALKKLFDEDESESNQEEKCLHEFIGAVLDGMDAYKGSDSDTYDQDLCDDSAIFHCDLLMDIDRLFKEDLVVRKTLWSSREDGRNPFYMLNVSVLNYFRKEVCTVQERNLLKDLQKQVVDVDLFFANHYPAARKELWNKKIEEGKENSETSFYILLSALTYDPWDNGMLRKQIIAVHTFFANNYPDDQKELWGLNSSINIPFHQLLLSFCANPEMYEDIVEVVHDLSKTIDEHLRRNIWSRWSICSIYTPFHRLLQGLETNPSYKINKIMTEVDALFKDHPVARKQLWQPENPISLDGQTRTPFYWLLTALIDAKDVSLLQKQLTDVESLFKGSKDEQRQLWNHVGTIHYCDNNTPFSVLTLALLEGDIPKWFKCKVDEIDELFKDDGNNPEQRRNLWGRFDVDENPFRNLVETLIYDAENEWAQKKVNEIDDLFKADHKRRKNLWKGRHMDGNSFATLCMSLKQNPSCEWLQKKVNEVDAFFSTSYSDDRKELWTTLGTINTEQKGKSIPFHDLVNAFIEGKSVGLFDKVLEINKLCCTDDKKYLKSMVAEWVRCNKKSGDRLMLLALIDPDVFCYVHFTEEKNCGSDYEKAVVKLWQKNVGRPLKAAEETSETDLETANSQYSEILRKMFQFLHKNDKWAACYRMLFESYLLSRNMTDCDQDERDMIEIGAQFFQNNGWDFQSSLQAFSGGLLWDQVIRRDVNLLVKLSLFNQIRKNTVEHIIDDVIQQKKQDNVGLKIPASDPQGKKGVQTHRERESKSRAAEPINYAAGSS